MVMVSTLLSRSGIKRPDSRASAVQPRVGADDDRHSSSTCMSMSPSFGHYRRVSRASPATRIGREVGIRLGDWP
jgi:hypothetical protein